MAITNAQQFKQLVNPPMKGNKRPGYRGDDAAKADRARSGGRNTSRADERGGVERDTGLERERQRNIAKIEKFKETKPEVKKIPPMGPIGIATNLFNKQLQKFSDFTTAKNRAQFERAIRAGKIEGLNFGTLDDLTEDELENAYQDYMSARMANEIDAFGNPLFSGGGGQPIIPQTMMALAPSITEQETEDPQGLEGLRLAFRADGGPIGGEYDFESARQMYGLGKLVKKVTRTVKKIAKSPIGKAAIAYTLTGGLGNLAQGQKFFTGFASPTSFLGGAKNIFSGEGLRNILVGRPESILSPGGKDIFRQAATKGIFGTGGQLSIGKAITAASLLPLLGIGTGEESEEEAEKLIRGEGLDINAIRANPNQFLARRFRAEGGSMKEPVAKKTMPLLDMGGKEMDLREEGGFVPIGRMEKADDVPARLSKNEFVFTADAVRNAGDGDVDKGAEVMYNMMKNLESGGDVSEESQGLEGARKMFQTSQRLEEVL